jgi:hypothetical protein
MKIGPWDLNINKITSKNLSVVATLRILSINNQRKKIIFFDTKPILPSYSICGKQKSRKSVKDLPKLNSHLKKAFIGHLKRPCLLEYQKKIKIFLKILKTAVFSYQSPNIEWKLFGGGVFYDKSIRKSKISGRTKFSLNRKI